tara:strand:- start:217 stop:549 length:333 start_codon:yes stop_codon:yes gene_type:complete
MYVPGDVSGTLSVLDATLLGETTHCDNIKVQVYGTWSGTITFESSLDGTNWEHQAVTDSSDNNSTQLHHTTNNGILGSVNIPGLPYFRARMSNYTSGTASVHIVATRSAK